METLFETRDGGERSVLSTGRLALCVLWARDEPHRAGELLIPPPDRSVVVGRFGIPLVQQRPGRTRETDSFTSPRISRRQFRVRVRDEDTLGVENLSKSRMAVCGQVRTQSGVQEGDLVEVERRLLLLCVRRPEVLPGPEPDPSHAFGAPDESGLVGESAAMWALRSDLAFIGPRQAHVLILGESGTGKELAATAVHRHSSRRRRALVSRSAATLPEALVDAELFGNARNYPNPGMPERPGLIGEADGGTLFLDEIGEMPQSVQTHLLRVLDAGDYQRLGESRKRTADLRLVAATNREPGHLKHDLLARFELRLTLPPLAARREDIPLLARALLRNLAGSDPDLADRFFDGDQPRISMGLVRHLVTATYTTHVRELRHKLWDVLATSSGDTLRAPSGGEGLEEAGDEPTADQIRAALAEADGVKTAAAELLGLRNRYQLLRLLKKHGLS